MIEDDIACIRELCKAIIRIAVEDYKKFVLDKKSLHITGLVGWFERYGGVKKELLDFFNSEWCNDILEHAGYQINGSELPDLIRRHKRKLVFQSQKDML